MPRNLILNRSTQHPTGENHGTDQGTVQFFDTEAQLYSGYKVIDFNPSFEYVVQSSKKRFRLKTAYRSDAASGLDTVVSAGNINTYFDDLSGTASGGSGDMLKAVYDTANNGIVDNAEQLNGQLASFYATQADLDKKSTAFSSTQYGKKTITINDVFHPVTTGNVANGWIDSSVGTWTVNANTYTLFATTTDPNGLNKLLLRPVSENSLNQQTYIKRSSVATRALLAQVLRYQTNGDHYGMNLKEGVVSTKTGSLELYKVVGGVKTIIATKTFANYTEGRTHTVEFSAINSLPTFLNLKITENQSGNVLIDDKIEDATSQLQTIGQSGLSVWRNTVGGTFDSVTLNNYACNKIENLVKVIGVGDSITVGTGSVGIQGKFGEGNGYMPVMTRNIGVMSIGYNFGDGGKRTDQLIARSTADIATSVNLLDSNVKAHIAVIQVGTNDIAQERKAAQVYQGILDLCLVWRNSGCKIIIKTILPFSSNQFPNGCNAIKNEVNELIRSNWTNFADRIDDVASSQYIGQDSQEADINYYTPDLIHPNTNGYKIAGEFTTNAINSILSLKTTNQEIANPIKLAPFYSDVDVVATTNIVLNNTQNVDGIDLVIGQKVLCVAQTRSTENRIWIVTNRDWILAYTDVQRYSEVAVKSGTLGLSLVYKCTNATNVTWREKENYISNTVSYPAIGINGKLIRSYFRTAAAATSSIGLGFADNMILVDKNPNINFLCQIQSSGFMQNGTILTIKDGRGNASAAFPTRIRSSNVLGGTVTTTAGSTTVATSQNLTSLGVTVGQFIKVLTERYKITALNSTTVTVDTAFVMTNTNTGAYAIEQDIENQAEILIDLPYGFVNLIYDSTARQYLRI